MASVPGASTFISASSESKGSVLLTALEELMFSSVMEKARGGGINSI